MLAATVISLRRAQDRFAGYFCAFWALRLPEGGAECLERLALSSVIIYQRSLAPNEGLSPGICVIGLSRKLRWDVEVSLQRF